MGRLVRRVLFRSGKWSEWGDWSSCSLETGLKTRTRKCQTNVSCIGKDNENIRCHEVNKNGNLSNIVSVFMRVLYSINDLIELFSVLCTHLTVNILF